MREFVPALEQMGLFLKEAWLTVYGEQPRLMAEAVINDLPRANRLISSEEWLDLGLQLNDFVENFEYKLIPHRTTWQM